MGASEARYEAVEGITPIMSSEIDAAFRSAPDRSSDTMHDNMYDSREPGLRSEMFQEAAPDQNNPSSMADRRGVTNDTRLSTLSSHGRRQLQDLSQSILSQVSLEAAIQCSQLQPAQICPPAAIPPEMRQSSFDLLMDVEQLASAMRSIYFRESDPVARQEEFMVSERVLKAREAERLRRLARSRGAKL